MIYVWLERKVIILSQRTTRRTKLLQKIDKYKNITERSLIDIKYKDGFIDGLEQAKKIIKGC